MPQWDNESRWKQICICDIHKFWSSWSPIISMAFWCFWMSWADVALVVTRNTNEWLKRLILHVMTWRKANSGVGLFSGHHSLWLPPNMTSKGRGWLMSGKDRHIETSMGLCVGTISCRYADWYSSLIDVFHVASWYQLEIAHSQLTICQKQSSACWPSFRETKEKNLPQEHSRECPRRVAADNDG